MTNIDAKHRFSLSSLQLSRVICRQLALLRSSSYNLCNCIASHSSLPASCIRSRIPSWEAQIMPGKVQALSASSRHSTIRFRASSNLKHRRLCHSPQDLARARLNLKQRVILDMDNSRASKLPNSNHSSLATLP